MITRQYRTIEECARLWVTSSFNFIDDSLVLGQKDFFNDWEFVGLDDDNKLVDTNIPMWSTYFEIADSCDMRWAYDHLNEISELGFTIIYREGYLWGLGIDGAGYDFYEAHWIPLYKLRGFTWHEDP